MTVETVSGPGGLGRPRSHADARARLRHATRRRCRTTATCSGARYWDEEERVADAIAKLTRVREGGIAHDRRSDGAGPRAQHPAHPAHQRRGRPQHHRRQRRLRVPRAARIPRRTAADQAIAELFVREITEGIDDTGVKAAFLKCAVERHGAHRRRPAHPRGRRDRRPSETGVPVMVHTNAAAQTGLLALETLTGARRRPDADRDRPRRRQQRPRLPARHRRHRAPGSASTASASSTSTRRRPDPHAARAARARATATASTSPTTPPASATSWSATRSSPTSSPTTCYLERRSSRVARAPA